MILIFRFILLSFFSFVWLLQCTSNRKIILSQARDAVRNERWVNKDTLQLLVPGKKYTNKAPVQIQRKYSCENAKKNTKKYFHKKYPKININNLTIEIRYTLYAGDNTCRLVVWYSQKNLKDKLLGLSPTPRQDEKIGF